MDKIIRAHHKGLGDSIQVSTLPQLLHQQGHDVYISSETPCNQQVYDLVWGMNPYVKGSLSLPGNCGEIPGLEYDNLCDSFIGNWEMINGLDYTNDYPIVYYQPKEIKSLKDATIIDMSCNSRNGDYNKDHLLYFASYNYSRDGALQLAGDGIYANDYGLPALEIKDIFHLCDVIASCKKYVCLNSGGHSLASALKRNKDIDVDCIVTHTPIFESMYVRKNFFYPNINYIWLDQHD